MADLAMTDTSRMTGRGGMRIINDALPHTGEWHTIIVCEDTVFDRLEVNGVDVRGKFHIVGLTYRAIWCAPITAASGPDGTKGKRVFTLIQLNDDPQGIVAAYKEWPR